MQNHLFKKIAASILLAALTINLTGCVSSSSSDSAKNTTSNAAAEESTAGEISSYDGMTIRITDITLNSIAYELGYFEDEFSTDGITVELVSIQGGPSFMDAISTDSVDFGILGDQPLISGYASGKSVKIIGTAGDDTEGYRLIAGKDSGITSAADIKGKKVAATAGTTTEKVLKTIMSAEGISENELEIVNLSEADSITALSTGDIDAMLVYANIVDPAVGDIITGYAPYGHSVHAIGANSEFIEKYPDLTVRVLKVLDRAAEWMNENKDESIKYISDLFEYTEEQATYIYEREYFRIRYNEEDAEVFNSTAQFLLDNGIIDHEVTSDEFVDTQYIELAGLMK